jgi:hypothetical protein
MVEPRAFEDPSDVTDDFIVMQGHGLMQTLGRFLFSRHQDCATLTKLMAETSPAADAASMRHTFLQLYHREQWRIGACRM